MGKCNIFNCKEQSLNRYCIKHTLIYERYLKIYEELGYKKCVIKNCGRDKEKLTFCQKHYDRWWKHGSPHIVFRLKNTNVSKHPLFHVYHNMKRRCYDENFPDYKDYGARGISMYSRWLGVNEILQFIKDIGERPTPTHTIDRIDNNGNYEPSNCKWATRKEQGNNRRTNSCYIINGHTYTAKQLAEKYNLPYQRLSDWLKKGIPPEEAIEKLSSMLSYTP